MFENVKVNLTCLDQWYFVHHSLRKMSRVEFLITFFSQMEESSLSLRSKVYTCVMCIEWVASEVEHFWMTKPECMGDCVKILFWLQWKPQETLVCSVEQRQSFYHVVARLSGTYMWEYPLHRFESSSLAPTDFLIDTSRLCDYSVNICKVYTYAQVRANIRNKEHLRKLHVEAKWERMNV